MVLLFREQPYLTSCDAKIVAVVEGDSPAVVLDQTVFYPMGGGQPGDRGWLRLADGGALEIQDTRKGDGPGDVHHIPAPGSPLPAVGTAVTAEIDWTRRHRLMRMHSALHILCALIEGDVTGGQIGDGKGRLDFNLPDTRIDKEKLEADLNRLVAEDYPLSADWITDEELLANPELVRTMSVKPPMDSGRVRLIRIDGVDLQPCGGTHVRSTGEIGRLRVGKIENKGRQNRRVNLLLET
jgi:misacylated tRNA(Ala) deacylase